MVQLKRNFVVRYSRCRAVRAAFRSARAAYRLVDGLRERTINGGR
ncbi:hypothetical protein [Nitrospira sp. Nam80]